MWCALDARNAGNAQHIAFFGGARGDQSQGGRQHLDATGGHRHAPRAGLAPYIDHVGLALGIKVGQRGVVLAHGSQDQKGLQRIHKKRASYEA